MEREAVVVIATRSIVDAPTAILAVATVAVLVYLKKVQEPHIIIIAAVIGLVMKSLL